MELTREEVSRAFHAHLDEKLRGLMVDAPFLAFYQGGGRQGLIQVGPGKEINTVDDIPQEWDGMKFIGWVKSPCPVNG